MAYTKSTAVSDILYKEYGQAGWFAAQGHGTDKTPANELGGRVHAVRDTFTFHSGNVLEDTANVVSLGAHLVNLQDCTLVSCQMKITSASAQASDITLGVVDTSVAADGTFTALSDSIATDGTNFGSWITAASHGSFPSTGDFYLALRRDNADDAAIDDMEVTCVLLMIANN